MMMIIRYTYVVIALIIILFIHYLFALFSFPRAPFAHLPYAALILQLELEFDILTLLVPRVL